METSAEYKVHHFDGENPTDKIIEALNQPNISSWLRWAISSAMKRDPVDAANEARFLSHLLDERLEQIREKGGMNCVA